jgi:hypothetical protein
MNMKWPPNMSPSLPQNRSKPPHDKLSYNVSVQLLCRNNSEDVRIHIDRPVDVTLGACVLCYRIVCTEYETNLLEIKVSSNSGKCDCDSSEKEILDSMLSL